jgi:phenylacetate-CoA ligase
VAFGYGLFTGGLGFHYGAERLGLTVIPASGGFTDRQVRLIADLRPEILLATPSYALVIADAFDRAGIDAAGCGLRLGVCGAEPWSEAMRTEIEARFGIDAYDTYGLSEVIGPGVAQELPGDKGALTIWEDHFLAEVVDPQTGELVTDGEAGELVFTTLTKQGMPVIRYRSRDLSRLLPPTTSALRRLERIKGRSDDMLVIRGVNVFPSQIEAVLGREPRLTQHYILELRRPARLDELTLRVEARREVGDTLDENARDSLERSTEKLIKDGVGVTVRVIVVQPDTIERSQGKARRVVDLRAVTS